MGKVKLLKLGLGCQMQGLGLRLVTNQAVKAMRVSNNYCILELLTVMEISVNVHIIKSQLLFH